MKKQLLIISLVLVLMLSTSMVFAQPVKGQGEGVVNTGFDKAFNKMSSDRLPVEVREEAQVRVNESRVSVDLDSDVRGLENALIHVDNEFAVGAIRGAMERFQERERFRYDSYEVVEVNGSLIVEAVREQRVLGLFNLKFEDVYELNPEGEILRERKSLLSRLFGSERIEVEQ